MSIHWTAGVGLTGADWILAAAIMAWLLLGEPLLGKRAFRQFLLALGRSEEDARCRFYRSWIIQGWVLMVLILAAAVLVFAWNASQLGLRVPQLSAHIPAGFVAGVVGGALVGVVIGIIAARRGKSRTPGTRPRTGATRQAESMKMLPRTPRERRWFAALAVTAGITEEVIWRGVLLALLVAAFPAMPMIVLVLIMSLVFGWAHLYQGLRGILATGMLGALLTVLYLATASLVLPIVLHVLIDLLAMLHSPAHSDTTASDSLAG